MSKHSIFLGKVSRAALAVLVALGLFAAPTSVVLGTQTAFAEVQKTDIVGSGTMADRGITASDMPSIDAKYAYVADEDGTVYFERGATEHTQIASITKVMTALVAIENADLDDIIYVSSNAASVGESSAGLNTGDTLTLAEALKALMIPSGNDAAIAIAESVGKRFLVSSEENASAMASSDATTIGSNANASGDAADASNTEDSNDVDEDEAALSAFVDKMNSTAAALGCTDSTFTNPHGLDEDEFAGDLHSSAADVYKICKKAMSYDAFSSIVKCESAIINITRDGEPDTLELTSTDELLGVVDGMCGIKTGFTDQAGPCFAGACERNGRMLYVIVLHSSSEASRFTDCETLIDWVFDNYVDYSLANTSTYADNSYGVSVPIVAKVALNAWIDKTVDVTFANPDETISVFKLFGNVSQSIELYDIDGAVETGQQVGVARFYQQNELVAERALIAAQTVEAPGIFERIGIWWDKIVRGWMDEPTVATSQILNTTPLVYEK